jgi:hypothetical protein
MKIGDFTIGLTIRFLNCSIYLQLMVFLSCECYWTSCNSCIKHLKLYIVPYVNRYMCNSNATNYSHWFFVQMPTDEWNPIWLFIHSSMDDFVCVLCNLFTTIISLVIHVNFLLKCCGQI